jgi:uncharacterized protein (DUF2147 family)
MIPFLLAGLAAASHPVRPAADPVIGTWLNPKGNVVVRTAHCGPAICASVVWADQSAMRAAEAGGTAHLVGTELLRDFRPTGPGQWEGQAFVPDIGQTVDSQMVQTDHDSLRIDGCALGGFLCKKQVWHRTTVPPRR